MSTKKVKLTNNKTTFKQVDQPEMSKTENWTSFKYNHHRS